MEEILRYVTVNQYEIFRAALEDVELDGQLVKKGDRHGVPAGRQPRPGQARLPRRPGPRPGHRRTPGVRPRHPPVHRPEPGRLELRTGLRALLQAFPDLRAATPAEEVPLRTRGSVFGLKSLPVSW
ncbi:hypothetical protein LT493_26860 [Streptomyces tricolor]|nr:hypothetical protein [Streptomyces tricolor]